MCFFEILINPNEYTFLLLNYESFQQPDSSSIVKNLVDDHKIDLIVIDEVHNTKKRDANESKRRKIIQGLLTLASEKNPDLYVLGMSATPVVNNLSEAVSLLEMIKGVAFDDLKTVPTIYNAIAIHEKLTTHGVRYRPKYALDLEETVIEISGDKLLDELKEIKKGDILGLEKVLLEAKLETVLNEIRPGTLIYTQYVSDIVPSLYKTLKSNGRKVSIFTGDDKTGLQQFLEGKSDVLIGSSTIGTGVDGLQYHCNHMIIVTLPWTSANYEQLIGRIYRQGSQFSKIEIIIPKVVIGIGDERWSWDEQRLDRIQWKKSLADAAVDGVIPEGELEKPESLHARAMEALKGWIERLENSDEVLTIERERLSVPLPEDLKQVALRKLGDFSKLNGRWNHAKSSTTHERLLKDPTEWHLYHTLYQEARKEWTEIPYEGMIEWLKDRPSLVVGDFGCGEAIISKSVSNKVYNFDHVAIDDSVIACDMSNIPLEDKILDLAIFSLSLMGSNLDEYLKEAHRLLKIDGRLKIVEPSNRWESEKSQKLIEMIEQCGFQTIGRIRESYKFLYIDAMKV